MDIDISEMMLHHMDSITVLGLPLLLRGERGAFRPALTTRELAPGVALVELVLTADHAAPPPALDLAWSLPAIDVQGIWRTNSGTSRFMQPDWAPAAVTAKATSQAPVVCLYGQGDANRLTFAIDDALHPSELSTGINEESGEMHCRVRLFRSVRAAEIVFRVQLRIDRRDVPFHEPLRDVGAWWATLYPPAAVPETGRRPMYSTWYSFHQVLDPARVVAECTRAKALGCSAVIVDDGWQTLDGNRGYAFCGDWEPERIPEMRGFVDAVHAEGLDFLLWYAVPFIGYKSEAYARFAGMALRRDDRMGAIVLDPRFPEVREFLIALYERHLKEWDLDGFKLDFVDSFHGDGSEPREAIGGRDIADVDEAVDVLLREVLRRLRAVKPDILVEFRQGYIGPLMRTYGNLLRAGDCPGDAPGNRLRTIDIRLLCGSTAAHADMLMWHPGEPVESAALQALAVLFAVPQLSVLLDRLPADHQEMVSFWTGWWNAHRAVLLDGWLAPRQANACYPLIEAGTATERVVAVYADVVATPAPGVPATLLVVNATLGDRVALDLPEDLGERTVTVRDCRGRQVRRERLRLAAGLRSVAVPPAGVVEITA